MILKEMTTHECRRNDELGSAGAPARCVTRLAGHSSGGFRRGRRKEQAVRPRSPSTNDVARACTRRLRHNEPHDRPASDEITSRAFAERLACNSSDASETPLDRAIL